MTRTRFAPSPNGPLHLGHAYAAIVAHDLAHSRGGEFLVRIEDIDGERSRAQWVEETLEDLRWLGLDWQGEVLFQSSRLASYAAAGERLMALGLIYPCTCTRRDVALAAHDSGPDGPVYPGTCRGKQADPGADVAWRLDVAKAMDMAGPLGWVDELAGLQRAEPQLFGDVVVLRRDAPASYHLAVTLDDAAQGIDLVIRGIDLFQATHIHRLLQAVLDLPVPQWHHHGLLVEADAKGHWRKLAKRRGSASLGDLRRAGEDGHALADAIRAQHFPAGISLSQDLHVLT
jgi:glutamyl-Q tRNA(Asp) synthetase